MYNVLNKTTPSMLHIYLTTMFMFSFLSFFVSNAIQLSPLSLVHVRKAQAKTCIHGLRVGEHNGRIELNGCNVYIKVDGC